jgi:hypothetical protein
MKNTLIAMSCLVAVAAVACTSTPTRRVITNNTGASGTNGASGTTGGSGTTGSAGASAGTTGSAGDTAGTTGAAGTGLTGTAGASGTTGTAGAGGGTAGDTGATAGTTGTAGASGTTGTAGASGTTGTAGTGASNAMACSETGGLWAFTPNTMCTGGNPSCGFCNANPGACAPAGAIDGDATTRYTSGQTQNGTEFFTLDFGATVSITGITLDDTASPKDFPIMYKAEYSTDGTTYVGFTPAVTGAGAITTAITFPKTSMRSIKISQTGMVTAPATSWWSIHEITVQGCTSP